MLRFIRFVVDFKEYISLAMLIVICFSLMSLGHAAELRGFRTVVVAGIGVAQNLFAWIPNPVALKSENKALRELNYYLSREVVKTRKALIENEKLRAKLEMRKQLDYDVISAEVVGEITAEMRNYFMLDISGSSAVQRGMAVVTDRGLVGHIIDLSENFAQVRSILNRDTRIAVKVERSRIHGILVWEGDPWLSLKNISKSQDVQAGDIVLTSGYSSIFPADINIGRVSEVRDDPSSMFRTVAITPFVNFETLEQVFINTTLPSDERLELRRNLERKLQNSKK